MRTIVSSKTASAQAPPKFNANGQLTPTGSKSVAKKAKAEKENQQIRQMSDPPKKPSSSYLFFSVAFIQKQTQDIPHKDKMKLAGQHWNALSQAEKNKYIKMAEQDKIRYQKEQAEFDRLGYFTYLSGPNKGSKSCEFLMSAKYFDKDIVMPKKAMTSFQCFVKSHAGKTKLTDCSPLWAKLSAKEKKKFEESAETDQQRFLNEMSSLQLNGYFINSEGVKSTDLKVKKKKGQSQSQTQQTQPDEEEEEEEEVEIPVVQPKKPCSAYTFYVGANLQKMMQSQGLNNIEAMKFCAQKWSTLLPKQKKPYEVENEKARLHYNKQLEMLETHGYFVMEDGKKSTDPFHVDKLQKKMNRRAATQNDSPKKKQKKP